MGHNVERRRRTRELCIRHQKLYPKSFAYERDGILKVKKKVRKKLRGDNINILRLFHTLHSGQSFFLLPRSLHGGQEGIVTDLDGIDIKNALR